MRNAGLMNRLQKPATSASRPTSWRHYALAWLVVGIGTGLTLAPDWNPASLIGFGIAGCVVCAVVGCLLYPVSRQARLIVAGASCGLLVERLLQTFGDVEATIPTAGTCWLMGAIIGASAAVWLLPVQIVERWVVRRASQAGSPSPVR
jgi:hypothetical protein